MERLHSGLGAVRTALRVSRSRPRLLALPVVNLLVVAGLTVATFLATGRLEWALSGGAAAGFGVPLLSTTLTAGLAAFLGVAVAHCVAATLDDDPATLRAGLRVAWSVRWPALAWGLLTAAIVPLVDAASAAGLGSAAGPLFVVPWTVATLFVVPALALDGGSLATALSRNAAVLRRRPVESLAAFAGALGVVAPLAVVGIPAATVTPAAGALGEHALKGAGLVLVAAATVLLQVLMVAAGVALYRETERRNPDPSATAPTGAGVVDS